MAGGLRERINDQLKEAIKAQEKRRVSTLRLVNAAFKDRDIQSRGTGRDDSPTDADYQGILAKMIKQRRDSAATYEQGGRPELAQAERDEIGIIQEFLPKQLGADEIEAAVKDTIDELECQGLKDMGRIMAALKDRYAGQMDFGKASALAKTLLG